ncbi:MAG: efflux RND transporter periplasmic adaptor subunit [Nitrospirae bacterium]|nr:efflux RND transporter periplasmic adaptor subunit [Nitrospirota bacterium]
MKKSVFPILSGLLLIIAVIFYLSKTGVFPGIFVAKKETPASTPAVSGHEGHGEEAASSQSSGQPAQENAEESPAVEVPLDRQQMIGVRTAEVAVRPLQKVIRTVGRIEYDERRLATVNTKFEGWIEKLHVDYTGRYIKKGEPLAEVYSPELVATQQELINALKWTKTIPVVTPAGKGGPEERDLGRMLSDDAGAVRDAARQRLRLWDISDEQIRKIEESGRPIRTLTLYSPANGYVVQKMAVKGMKVMPGEKLFDIADLSTVWIVSDVYENELPLIKAGQQAHISLSYLPGKDIPATIDYIYPSLSGETRTAKVRFVISNPSGQLKPQMFTNVEVKIPLGNKLAVPDEAVLDTGERQIVYVDKGDGYFEPREVRLGMRAEGLREVLAGLKAGEKVAAAATFLIDSEAQLKGVKPLEGHKH